MSISESTNLQRAISIGLKLAFVILVVYVLAYSIPIIIEWPLFITILYLLMSYSILYPFALSLVPSNIAYYAYIPASFIGLEVSIIFWLNRFGMLFQHVLLISVFTAFCILTLFHYWTRQGLVIYRKFLYGGLGLDLKRMTRVGGMMIAPFFLIMSVIFSIPDLMTIPLESILIVVSSLIFLYTTFSVLGLNVAYRTKLVNEKLGIKDFNSHLTHLGAELLKKYPHKKETVNFFSFVLRSEVDDFIYGDYERSYLDGYRIIHDKIIRSPKTIVLNRVDRDTLNEYRRIRVFLVHGFLKERESSLETPIQIEDVIWARKVLFKKTLDLIDLSCYVASKI